jgi:hypothetical protein
MTASMPMKRPVGYTTSTTSATSSTKFLSHDKVVALGHDPEIHADERGIRDIVEEQQKDA